MTELFVQSEHLAQIRTHAQQTYPEECCGLLLGQIDEHKLIDVVPVANSWGEEAAKTFGDGSGGESSPVLAVPVEEELANPKGSRRNRFSIDPQVMLQMQKAARDRHLDIMGIYHSHPDNPAVPSEFDRAIAWSSYSYIIVSVEQGRATELYSWTLDEDHQFQPEEILTIDSKVSKS